MKMLPIKNIKKYFLLLCDLYLSLFLENISGHWAQAINEDTWSRWLTQSSVRFFLLSFLFFFIWILLFIYPECCLISSQTLWAGSVIIYTYLCVLLFSNFCSWCSVVAYVVVAYIIGLVTIQFISSSLRLRVPAHCLAGTVPFLVQ